VTSLLRVLQPGLFSTVQDLGRPHAAQAGVSPGGAMDRFAHRAANLLAGNEAGAATIECTVRGPRLAAEGACLIAIAGADLDPRVNGEPVETWTSIALREGDELAFGTRRWGARAYIAIAGGVGADRWLGSRSTDLVAGRGGMQGRPIQAGDLIAAAGTASDAGVGRRHLSLSALPAYGDPALRVIEGPHFKSLDVESRARLLDSPFQVSRDADRMGFRLDGGPLNGPDADVLSFGLVAGAVQVPPGGRPILLMAAHQTAGGYPVVATVISASMPVASQLVPGDVLRFVSVSPQAALEMRRSGEAALASLRD
jgi:antagonist of KipI